MTYVLTGFFARDLAEEISQRAANSDVLFYPAAATFEEPGNPQSWRVDIYLHEDVHEAVLIEELGPDAATMKKAALPEDTDWVKEGLKDLKPVIVGRNFVYGSHDADKVRAHHHAILIEANQAFGTGHHGTTAGCLEAITLVTKRYRYRNILDLGTGSGVLAAALALETRLPVLATDIDPVSVSVARENMRLNGVQNLVSCVTAAGFHHPVFRERGPFGLVVANILAGPLRALAYPMSKHLAAHATIILSGLLIHQQASVLAAYRAQGATLSAALHREGWATLILERP